MSALSKVRLTTKTLPYPQTESLADTMRKYGTALGANSDLGKALMETSEAYRQIAAVRSRMVGNVERNFLDPLTHLQQTDLKEVHHHRTKVKSRRLDFDYKKRKQVRDEKLKQAKGKLEESKQFAEQAMHNLLSSDTEQVSPLCALVDAQLDFHRQTTQILEKLQQQLRERVSGVNSRSRTKHTDKSVFTDRLSSTRWAANVSNQRTIRKEYSMVNGDDWSLPAVSSNASVSPSLPVQAPPPYWGGSALPAHSSVLRSPAAKALYDFEAQNEDELDFKEGDIIRLISQIDENWFKGSIRGKSGYFPTSYVQVLVPL
uniref:Uncharacterized protein n=1 Tax=Parascaris univalens TaxID=6257 RepID=A0A915A056_PARUN